MRLAKKELPFALLMSGCFFIIISIFWILKPLKKTFFIQTYDLSGFVIGPHLLSASQAELLAKILNLGVAILTAYLFARLAKSLRREKLLHAFCLISAVIILALKASLAPDNHWAVWSFYLFGDFFIMAMVAGFFAFSNDIATTDFAKRLYGLIGFGGVAGGVFGSTLVRIWIETFSLQTWLSIALALVGILAIVAHLAGRVGAQWAQEKDFEKKQSEWSYTTLSNPQAGWAPIRTVLASPYLLGIAILLVCYEMVSTLVDFQFTSAVSHSLDGAAIGKYFSGLYATTNAVSLVTQLFVTSFVMARFGVLPALLVLPISLAFGSVGYLMAPSLLAGSILSALDNSFNYSIYQSSREALYVRVPREILYQAKPVLDIFAVRFGKVLSILLTLAASSFLTDFSLTRWLAILTLALLAIWILFSFKVGRRFDAEK